MKKMPLYHILLYEVNPVFLFFFSGFESPKITVCLRSIYHKRLRRN